MFEVLQCAQPFLVRLDDCVQQSTIPEVNAEVLNQIAFWRLKSWLVDLQPLEHHHFGLWVDIRALDAVGSIDFLFEEPGYVSDVLEVNAFQLEYFHDLVEHGDHAIY